MEPTVDKFQVSLKNGQKITSGDLRAIAEVILQVQVNNQIATFNREGLNITNIFISRSEGEKMILQIQRQLENQLSKFSQEGIENWCVEISLSSS